MTREVGTGSATPRRRAPWWLPVVAYGTVAGAVAAVAGNALPAAFRPAASLVVLLSTLLVGRRMPLRVALTYGACAWGIAVSGSRLLDPSRALHSVAAVLISLVLVEEVALLGRLTAICRTRANARGTA